MKRLLLVFVLILSMVFTSCMGVEKQTESSSGDGNPSVASDSSEESVASSSSDMEESALPEIVRLGSQLDQSAVKTVPALDYHPVHFNSQYKTFKIADDLSNIANIQRFTGLSENQKSMLAKNGFVVIGRDMSEFIDPKMYNVYDRNYYNKIPSFYTVDTNLNLFHIFFDNVLKSVEKEHLVMELSSLSAKMLDQTLEQYKELKNADLPASEDYSQMMHQVQTLAAYFAVPVRILSAESSSQKLPEEIEGIVQKEIKKIESHSDITLNAISHKDVNYKQFKPRGHYVGNQALEKYFKAMSWYGIVGFEFVDDQGAVLLDNVRMALLFNYFMGLETGEGSPLAYWDTIYQMTELFAGPSDDLNIYHMEELKSALGDTFSLINIYSSSHDEQLREAVKQLPDPGIQNKKLGSFSADTAIHKQFRFMGQRYTIDGNIMQEFMVPIKRPFPSGLDVAYLLGSQRAGDLAKSHTLGKMEAKEYASLAKKVKANVEKMKLEDWQKNIYNGQLWAISSVFEDPNGITLHNENKNPELPPYLTSQAWVDRRIVTGLGNYAELKHDTILYSKQPAAEKGGMEPEVEFESVVEPAPETYNRLLWLTKYSKKSLEERGLLSESLDSVLEQMERIYQTCLDVSIKQINGEEMNEEERRTLLFLASLIESVEKQLDENFLYGKTSSLVADVAYTTDTKESFNLATGLPEHLLVAVEKNGQIYLTYGTVFSYYEFESQDPLTDQEWIKHLGVGIEKETYEGMGEMTNYVYTPTKQPNAPAWVWSFKSKDNDTLKITPVEY